MIELEQNDVLEETEYDSIDLDDEGLDGSETFPRLTRANYVDRVRFVRVPNESRQFGKGDETAASADPLYIYYRSMSKIPLLTRDEEVYLAKKIEAAKINTLRLLALTSISSARLVDLGSELQPACMVASAAASIESIQDADVEIPLEERNRVREKEIRRIFHR